MLPWERSPLGVEGVGVGRRGVRSVTVYENSRNLPKQRHFNAFSQFFLMIPAPFLSKIFKIFSVRASGARECLLSSIGGRRAQNELAHESMRLGYLEKTR